MKIKNQKVKSEVKMVSLSFVIAFIGAIGWQILLHAGAAVYLSKKLGSREAGNAAMNELFRSNTALIIFSYVVMELIILLVAYLFVRKFNDKKFKLSDIGMEFKKNSTGHIAWGFGIVLLMQGLMYLLFSIMGLLKFNGSESFNAPAYKVVGTIILALAVTAFPGFIEEILFRGVILNYLMRSKGKVFALIISSMCFSIMHVVIYPNLMSLIYVFITGFVLGYLYIVTKSLYLPIGIHFAWDFYSTIIGEGSGIFNIKKAITFDIINNNENLMTLITISAYLLLLLAVIIKSRVQVNRINISNEQR